MILRIDRFRLYSVSRSERVIILNAPRLYDTVAGFTIVGIGTRSEVDNFNKETS
jgi:hypothetical protein